MASIKPQKQDTAREAREAAEAATSVAQLKAAVALLAAHNEQLEKRLRKAEGKPGKRS